MDIVTTMTTPASSLRAALRQGCEAFGFDLSGSNPALGTSKRPVFERPVFVHLASKHLASQAAIFGPDAQTALIATGGEYASTRRPQPSRFFPLSQSEQVS